MVVDVAVRATIRGTDLNLRIRPWRELEAQKLSTKSAKVPEKGETKAQLTSFF